MPDMTFLRETGEYKADRLLELVVRVDGSEVVIGIDRRKALTFNLQIAAALAGEDRRGGS